MAENNIFVKISADASKFVKAIEDVEKKSEDLKDQLEEIGKKSALAFAALSAAIGGTVFAYAESEKATKSLTLALQNQGIASDKLLKKYSDLADEVQAKTGIDDDAIKSGLSVIQTFLGQEEASSDLVGVLADLSEKEGSVESAAQALGLAINGNARALKRYGVTVDETATKSERISQITQQLKQNIGGAAEAANTGLGKFKSLKTELGTLAEGIGKIFAPAFELAISAVVKFFQFVNQSPIIKEVLASTLLLAAGVTGIVAAFAVAGLAMVKFREIILISEIAMKAFGLTTKGLFGAAGVFGLIILVIGELAIHWKDVFEFMSAVYSAFVNNITSLGSGIKTFFEGLITFDRNKIANGLKEATDAALNGYKDFGAAYNAESTKQEADKDKLAKERRAKEEEEAARKRAILTAENELVILKLQDHSKSIIDLKQQEIDTLKQLDDEKYSGQKEALTQHLEEIRLLQEQAILTETEQKEILANDILAKDDEFQALSSEQQTLFLAKNQENLLNQVQTEQQVRDAALNERLAKRIAEDNKFLATQQQFGTVVAELEKITQSKRLEALSQGLSAFSGLQRSKNKELQAIGKAAAITQIGIDTAKGALAAYTNMIIAIPFPPVAIPLGIAAAAAVVATGAQSIADVVSAQRGGIVPGASMGGDSVPAILEPGELVVPRANFGEVVNAVAAQRIQDSPVASSGVATGGGGGGSAMITIGFEGQEAEKVLTARQVESRSLGILREAQT